MIACRNEVRKLGAVLERYSQREVFALLAAFDRTDSPPTAGERVPFEVTVGRHNRDEAAGTRYMDRFADEKEDGLQVEASDSVKKTVLTAFVTGLTASGGYCGCRYVAENNNKIIPYQQNEVTVKQMTERIHVDRQAWRAVVSGPGHNKVVKTKSQSQEKAKVDGSIGGWIMQPFNKEEGRCGCDGRRYCSEMTSLDGVKYFIKHCLDIKTDGDHDDEPYESGDRWR